MVAAIREHTLLPLDDCLYALQVVLAPLPAAGNTSLSSWTAKRLKTLRGITPYERVCKAWADDPDRFRYDPTHLTSGLNT